MSTVKLGIVGVGKIVRDQHLPSIANTAQFELVAAASRNAAVNGVQNFTTIEEMLGAVELDAVVLCMPPQYRYAAARLALAHGKHVFLEKPPGATLSEVEALAAIAADNRTTLFASWHSRFAPAVEPAREWLGSTAIRSVNVVWKEDVRTWHPGQAWIWQPGGFGVFDPGINALSIVTRILPRPIHLVEATLDFPANRATPIAARLDFVDGGFVDGAGMRVTAEFDWRQVGQQSWDIEVHTERGTLLLADGGSRLLVDGNERVVGENTEYATLYARFAKLIASQRSDVDLSPIRHVADAFMLGERRLVDAFHD